MQQASKVDCNNQEKMVGINIRICTNLELQRADSIMQEEYKAGLKMINSFGELLPKGTTNPAIAKYIASQKAWLEYRKRWCDVGWDMADKGSEQAIIYMNCLIEITNERTKALKASYE